MDDKQLIRAAGNFMVYYEHELRYIKTFHDYKGGKMIDTKYLSNTDFSFDGFLGWFRVARNRSSDKSLRLLEESVRWCRDCDSLDVNGFAQSISEEITFNKLAVSLSSKILFLNDPLNISPYDERAKNAVGYHGNDYKEYIKLVNEQGQNIGEVKEVTKMVIKHAEVIEKDFVQHIEDLEGIRQRRILDKVLWVKGGK